MFTNDRLDVLANSYGLMRTVPLVNAYASGLHSVLDLFDKTAGINTSGGTQPAPLGRTGLVAVNPIGARLALHEQRLAHRIWDQMDSAPQKYFHWLGGDACCSCGCGEHRRTG